MNEYSSLRKQNKRSIYATVIAMVMCVVLTTTMLVSQLAEFTAPDTQHYIPLTKSTGTTRVYVGQRQADGSVTYDSLQNMRPNGTLLAAMPGFQTYDENTVYVGRQQADGSVTYDSLRNMLPNGTQITAMSGFQTYDENTVYVGQRQADGSVTYDSLQNMRPNGTPLTAMPGFRTYDENTVWSGETDVQIFSISYDNDSGETTVRSRDGVKVLAPGTGSSYRFTLENTGNVPLKYTMEMDAWFSHGEYPIPIYASVTDYEGHYLLGSEEEKVDVLRLKEVRESGTIDAGYLQPYTLNWEWPFELDDAYDTMLGNLAVDNDITLTIAIRTGASYYGDDDPGGYPPQTGDESHILLYGVLMFLSLAGLLLLLAMAWKEREKKHA